MKKGILFLLLATSVFAHAQTLKDALFSGKLKNDPGTVVRKGDDLSTKIDTTRKVTADETGKTNATFAAPDSSSEAPTNQSGSDGTSSINQVNNNASSTDTAATASKEATPVKNNNVLLKIYMDSVASTLKSEVLPSKKVKRGDYSVLVTYTIGTDGEVAVTDVFLSPENSYLQQQIKERLTSDTPRLNPVLNSAGVPRKVFKKYSFVLSKQ